MHFTKPTSRRLIKSSAPGPTLLQVPGFATQETHRPGFWEALISTGLAWTRLVRFPAATLACCCVAQWNPDLPFFLSAFLPYVRIRTRPLTLAFVSMPTGLAVTSSSRGGHAAAQAGRQASGQASVHSSLALEDVMMWAHVDSARLVSPYLR